MSLETTATCWEVSIPLQVDTYSLSVHFWRMTPNYLPVQTVTTGRLRFSQGKDC
jgi:hypothetical protein